MGVGDRLIESVQGKGSWGFTSKRFPAWKPLPERNGTSWRVAASPMMEWEYFYALEKSRSVSDQKGYYPCHLVAYNDHEPIALAPLYERDRAWVEFGDGGLLEVAERNDRSFLSTTDLSVRFPSPRCPATSSCIAPRWTQSRLPNCCWTISIFIVKAGTSQPRASTSSPLRRLTSTRFCGRKAICA